MSNKDDIQTEYGKLAKETGDLYFQLENARDLLRSLEDKIASCRLRRGELNKAYAAALKEEESTNGAAVEPALID